MDEDDTVDETDSAGPARSLMSGVNTLLSGYQRFVRRVASADCLAIESPGAPVRRAQSLEITSVAEQAWHDDSDDDDALQPIIAQPSNSEQLRAKLWRGATLYVPILSWLPNYAWRRDGLADAIAGLCVSFLLVPQCIAYAMLARLPPNVGLYAGFFQVLLYAVFGTSRHLAAGPEGLLSLLVGSTLSSFAFAMNVPSDPASLVPYAAALSFLVGLFTLLLSFLRVGFLDNLMSSALLAGFVSAAALLIIEDQLASLFGFALPGSNSIDKLVFFCRHIGQTKPLTLCVGASSIALIVAIDFAKSRLSPIVPAFRFIPTTLIIVLAGIAIGTTVHHAGYHLPIVGHIDRGFLSPGLSSMWDIWAIQGLLGSAIIISIVGFIEAMASAKRYALQHSYRVRANQDLLAFGLGNMIGGLFQAYPVFASLPRTRVSDESGTRTQLVGCYAALFTLASILYLGAIFYYLPTATIAAIVVVAAGRLIEWREFALLLLLREWTDLSKALLTLLVTFFFGPELGVLFALSISAFQLIKRATAPALNVLGVSPAAPGHYVAIDACPEARPVDDALLLRIVATALDYANVQFFYEASTKLMAVESPQHCVRTVIIDMAHVRSLDVQGAQMLVSLDQATRAAGRRLCLVRLPAVCAAKLQACAQANGDTIDESLFQPSIEIALHLQS